nr:hypothetical protein CFP56_46780 [Quercus suber]
MTTLPATAKSTGIQVVRTVTWTFQPIFTARSCGVHSGSAMAKNPASGFEFVRREESALIDDLTTEGHIGQSDGQQRPRDIGSRDNWKIFYVHVDASRICQPRLQEERLLYTFDRFPGHNPVRTERPPITHSQKLTCSSSLALQQYIWQQALGFNIHPSIPALGSNASVADVACGTALWLVEVGRELGPSSDLHAFDINLNQAPPEQWLPRNLQLHSWNLFDDVPLEFVGNFDLVHVRLITVVIKDNDPVKVMQNFHRLLSQYISSQGARFCNIVLMFILPAEPGGYLQWDEVDVFRSFVVKAYPELDVPHMDAWCEWMGNPKKEHKTTIANEWKAKAVDLLGDHGFEAVKRHDMTDKFLEHMELMRYNNDQRVFTSGHERDTNLLKTVEAAAGDTEKGAVMIMPPFCWVAKKLA